MSRAQRKRQSAAQTTATDQCVVNSDQALGRKCSRALEQALDLNNVKYQAWKYPGKCSLIFFTPPVIEAEIRGRNRPMLAMPQHGNRWLHVAIDLHFIAKKQWRVNHISIGLLQGDRSTIQKEQLLRAEWQAQENSDAFGHAQPHWHVLSAAGLEESPTFDEVVETTSGFEKFLTTSTDTKSAGNEAFAHFHYAMVADWHITPSKGPYQVLADEGALLSWLKGCVRYIRHQLNHVDRKAGS